MTGLQRRSLAWRMKHRWLIWRYRYARWRHPYPEVLTDHEGDTT